MLQRVVVQQPNCAIQPVHGCGCASCLPPVRWAAARWRLEAAPAPAAFCRYRCCSATLCLLTRGCMICCRSPRAPTHSPSGGRRLHIWMLAVAAAVRPRSCLCHSRHRWLLRLTRCRHTRSLVCLPSMSGVLLLLLQLCCVTAAPHDAPAAPHTLLHLLALWARTL